MAMEIHEYSDGAFNVNIVEDNVDNTNGINVTESELSTSTYIDPNSLMVEIEGIHAYPHATRNFTRYMPECLRKSIPSWTKPYNRPLIKHHNEKNGTVIGRIIAAEYKTNNTFSNTPAILFTANVPGESAKTSVQNGTESTVSIGVIAHDVRCSICGQQLASGEECDHERGAKYGKEICYWDIHSMEAKELSYVVVPSDVFAKNVKIYPASKKQKTPEVTESFNAEENIKGEPLMADNKDAQTANVPSEPSNTLDVQETLKQVLAHMEESKSEIANLKSVRDNLERRLDSLEGDKNYYKTAHDTAAATKDALEKKVEELTNEIDKMKGEAKEAASMKEGLETALEEAKVAAKECLIDTAQAYRIAVGKEPFADDDIRNRSEEAIRCAIKDMKEELNTAKVTGINTTESVNSEENTKTEEPAPQPEPPQMPEPIKTPPSVVENEEEVSNKNKQMKEDAELRNVDLEAGIESLFGSIMSARRI